MPTLPLSMLCQTVFKERCLMSEENKWSVVKFVQEILADEKDKSAITPQIIV